MLHNKNSNATFKHFKLDLFEPEFKSHLTDLIIELDYLRKKPLGGSTHPQIFFQLKNIFHILESIGSARIEGNNTTIAEYIETKIGDTEKSSDKKIIEINNSEDAMRFIDDNIANYPINKMLISELHKQIVKDLPPPPNGEGSKTPGKYREENLKITKSKHAPPEFLQVQGYMDELLDFISNKDAPKYDLLKTAIVHHRFAWIHPFDNGNGRTVRLLTYAMLVKQGFNINVGRIINPTAVFCIDRNKYYDALSWADTGTSKGILQWCEYVLSGLRKEIQKIDRLLNYNYLAENILFPTITMAKEREHITDLESKILQISIKNQVFMSSDIEHLMAGKVYTERSRVLRKLRGKKMIAPLKSASRKYVIRFDNNYLLRSIIEILAKNGFVPMKVH